MACGNRTHLSASVSYVVFYLRKMHETIDSCASDTFMSKTTRLYQDTRTANAAGGPHLDKLNDELQDVTRIMTKNMEELLWRGDSLDSECCCSGNTFTSIPVYMFHLFLTRDVSPIDLAAFRIGEVPPGGEKYQYSSNDSAVRTHRRGCTHPPYFHLLAILVKRDRLWICFPVFLYVFTLLMFPIPGSLSLLSFRHRCPLVVTLQHASMTKGEKQSYVALVSASVHCRRTQTVDRQLCNFKQQRGPDVA